MELSEQQELWEDFTGAIGFRYQGYNLVEEVRSIFDFRDTNVFRGYLFHDRELKLSFPDEYSYCYASNKAIRYVLVNTISKRNIDFIDWFTNESQNKRLRCLVLIRLCNLLHGIHVLTEVATNSDFWSVIDGGQFYDNNFLSFHLVNYLYHTGDKLTNENNNSSNLQNITSMICHCDIYTEEKINETRFFAGNIVKKIRSIFQSGYFDETLLSIFEKINPVALNKEVNADGKGLIEYVNNFFVDSFRTEPIYIARLQGLIEEKLEN